MSGISDVCQRATATVVTSADVEASRPAFATCCKAVVRAFMCSNICLAANNCKHILAVSFCVADHMMAVR